MRSKKHFSIKLLFTIVIFAMVVFLILPYVSTPKTTRATDNWWDTDYLRRARINITATRGDLPVGTPVQISFDSHYLISAETPSNQKMRSDGKDLRIIYDDGSGPIEIDRDTVSDSWNDTDATVFFATQSAISYGASSNDYWLYYDYDSESTSPLSTKANIYGSHTKSYIPFSDRTVSNRIAATITVGSGALNSIYEQKGVNGYGDMAVNNQIQNIDHVTMSSSTDLGATEGTVELWAKDLVNASRESVLWSEEGCVDVPGRGCFANYESDKINWNVMMSNASTILISQSVADSPNPYTNTWRQMAFTWKRVGGTGGEAKVYRDGIVIAEASWADKYISYPQDIGKMRVAGLPSFQFAGGVDEFRSSDYAKEPADFINYTYNAEIEANFYGDRNMMEVARSNYEVAGSGITTVQSYWFADIDDNYFYALTKDKAATTDPNTGAIGPFLTKQRKSDLAVMYYYDVGAYATAKGIPAGSGVGVAFTANTSSSPPRLMVTIRDSGYCNDDGEIAQFTDTGSAFEFEYAYEHDDLGVPPYNKLTWAQYVKYNSFDQNFYVSVWHGDRTCVGGSLLGAGTSKRPGVVKINPIAHSVEYLQLYEMTNLTAETRDDGLVNMDIDENGNYMYVARYNRDTGTQGSFYKIDLSNFTQVGTWYGVQASGVGITKLAGENAVLVDGRTDGRELGKLSTTDGSLISGVNSPNGYLNCYGNFTGSAHVLMPVSEKAVLISGGANVDPFAGLAWIADTTTWAADPIAYEIGSRRDGNNDSLLMGSDGYIYMPPAHDNLTTKFSPGISSTYSTVTPSATTVVANGSTPVTFSINLKSIENKATLPENLSVKVIPSNSSDLTLSDSSGYQLEQGFSGSTDPSGNATVSIASSKTRKVNFTVYAEGIELDQIEINFTGSGGTKTQIYTFENSGDYVYNNTYLSVASSKASRVPGFIPGVGWAASQKITIDHTKVAGDLENFPVMIQISDENNPIFTTAQTDGDDILFNSSDGVTKLSHDLEQFITTEGSRELIAWVKIPTLSSTTDTDIYIYYGNPTATAQQNKAGTWSGHTAVWHMDEASWVNGSADVVDSGPNGYTGTSANSAATVSSGIYREGSFNGATSWVSTGMTTLDSFTVEGWVVFDGGADYFRPFTDAISGSNYPWVFGAYPSGSDRKWRAQIDRNGATVSFNTTNITIGQRYHAALTYNSTTDVATIWIDGVLQGTGSVAGDARTTTAHRIGNYSGQSGRSWNGEVDEVKISPTVRSSQWLLTEYNNLYSPATFFGSESEVTHASPGSSTSMTPDSGFTYYSLSSFYETTINYNSDEGAKYQISNDNGTTWYWWNGSAWVATTAGFTEANTDDEINAHISSFSDGNTLRTFMWKMVFVIDDTTYPEIDTLTIGYNDSPPASSSTPDDSPVSVLLGGSTSNTSRDLSSINSVIVATISEITDNDSSIPLNKQKSIDASLTQDNDLSEYNNLTRNSLIVAGSALALGVVIWFKGHYTALLAIIKKRFFE